MHAECYKKWRQNKDKENWENRFKNHKGSITIWNSLHKFVFVANEQKNIKIIRIVLIKYNKTKEYTLINKITKRINESAKVENEIVLPRKKGKIHSFKIQMRNECLLYYSLYVFFLILF